MTNENEWVTGQLTLNVGDTRFEMEMTVPAFPVKPTRVLPVFQQMTSTFVEASVSDAEADGDKVSCKAGCGACCNQAVPLSEIEAYNIAEIVENMDEPRRSEIKQKFEAACQHFHETKWFERMEDYANLSLEDRRKIVLEYFYDGVSCPFLENNSCSIHSVRPLACREYLVTSPAENCAAPTAETVRLVNITIEPSKTLREMWRSENLRKTNFLPMIRALEWADENPENMPERNGTEWLTDFINRLAKRKSETETETAQTIDK